MSKTKKKAEHKEAQCPLILRCHRLMEAFAKSDDERDFFLDRQEGFIIYVDLDKSEEELAALNEELVTNFDRYLAVPKLTFYETKKIMEGFVNEKVYDIDIKEKLLEIIQSKEARENFLDFIFDHEAEMEKWQQFYQERSRIRIIEWLRQYQLRFVFEEDLDLTKSTLEKLKLNIFEKKVPKELESARKVLETKSKTYYSNEALNPRPKRGRPPKQAAKQEVEIQVSTDIYTAVPGTVRPFLFTPDLTSASAATFSSKFENEEDLLASRKLNQQTEYDLTLENLNKKLASLRELTTQLVSTDSIEEELAFNNNDLEIEEVVVKLPKKKPAAKPKAKKTPAKKTKTEKKEPKTTTKAKSATKKK